METSAKSSKKAQKRAEKGNKVSPKTDTSHVYELGYIFVPSITEDRVRVEEKVLADLFTKAGGEMISHEQAILIDLAYPMLKVIHAHRQKCHEGYFGWMKLEIETEKIADIKKALDASEFVLRYLLVKTIRENTLLTGKMNLHHGDEKMKKVISGEDAEIVEDAKPEVAPEINEEALDKSIDDLVIV